MGSALRGVTRSKEVNKEVRTSGLPLDEVIYGHPGGVSTAVCDLEDPGSPGRSDKIPSEQDSRNWR